MSYPKGMKDLPEFREFCDDMIRLNHSISVDKGFPFVHVNKPEDIWARTHVWTDWFEEPSSPGTFCFYPVETQREVNAVPSI